MAKYKITVTMSKYKKISKNIDQVIIDNPKTPDPKDKLVWLNISNAGKKELEYLRKNYNFELTHLQASLGRSTAQRPDVSQGKDYLFMILHFPILQKMPCNNKKKWRKNINKKNKNEECDIITGEIEFFIGHGYLVTLHNNNIKAINEFFNHCKKDSNSLLAYEFESSAVLLYELLKKLMINCYPILDQNSIRINQIEEIIFAQHPKKAVSQILSLRHNIINFRKIMQSHKNIMKKLIKMESSLVPREQIRKYYNILLEHSKRIWEILDNQKEMIEVLNSTNESMLNYRISDIMKTLTIFSVIVFPLTLLAAIFGMNTLNGMPFTNHENGFWIIIIIMLIGCLGMLIFFEKKKWM